MKLTFDKILQIFLLIAIFGLTLLSCKSNRESENQDVQMVNTNDLTMGPIVHDTLSPDQIKKIKKIQTVFSEVNPSTLEQTITDFKRDRNPDNEIAVWLAMANAYEKFNKSHTALNIETKKEAYVLILLRSIENEADAKAKANLKLLTDKEVSEIFSYYDLEPKPLIVEQK